MCEGSMTTDWRIHGFIRVVQNPRSYHHGSEDTRINPRYPGSVVISQRIGGYTDRSASSRIRGHIATDRGIHGCIRVTQNPRSYHHGLGDTRMYPRHPKSAVISPRIGVAHNDPRCQESASMQSGRVWTQILGQRG